MAIIANSARTGLVPLGQLVPVAAAVVGAVNAASPEPMAQKAGPAAARDTCLPGETAIVIHNADGLTSCFGHVGDQDHELTNKRQPACHTNRPRL